MPIEARLFDAAGTDRVVSLDDHPLVGIASEEILWVDVPAPTSADLDHQADAYEWEPETIDELGRDLGRARLRLFPGYVHLTIESVVCNDQLRTAEIHLLVGREFVIPFTPLMCQP